MHRGPEQLVAIMATILAGAAYLPIDAGCRWNASTTCWPTAACAVC